MLNEEVRNIMTKDPIIAHPDDTIEQVSDMMVENQIQQLPVVKDGKLEGMITSYDLWRNSKTEKNPKDQHVSEVMTTKIIRIAPKDKVGTAAELFIDRRFKTLPVVNLRNELKGVITAFDLIKYIMKKEYAHPILFEDILKDEEKVN